MTPDERADLLESNEQLASVHAASAQTGQTQAPDLNAKIDLHFVCFTEVDHHLYELDGRKTFPINHGRCTDLVDVSSESCSYYRADYYIICLGRGQSHAPVHCKRSWSSKLQCHCSDQALGRFIVKNGFIKGSQFTRVSKFGFNWTLLFSALQVGQNLVRMCS